MDVACWELVDRELVDRELVDRELVDRIFLTKKTTLVFLLEHLALLLGACLPTALSTMKIPGKLAGLVSSANQPDVPDISSGWSICLASA